MKKLLSILLFLSNGLLAQSTGDCNDPEYLEFYDSDFIWCDWGGEPSDEGSCITPVSIGCMDTTAINYSPSFNLDFDLCIYSNHQFIYQITNFEIDHKLNFYYENTCLYKSCP